MKNITLVQKHLTFFNISNVTSSKVALKITMCLIMYSINLKKKSNLIIGVETKRYEHISSGSLNDVDQTTTKNKTTTT